ncbi:Cu(I)-responsive transcriptional regulator [Halopseudomonas sabulinigri]|uniref:Cu(I)-responsive transcriptional regulator n=1 Tax=Halopseudomonas sabulinigri TaxID=472181 RepID=A0A1H1L365_9GAMM|nr:Cu(I)-responsive transcriptional regulator [Halopseudomonas sabulinigri]SDR68359.1 Cu(I)-responsive transcriptional regulator [Halopseudomonas sabulinigri]
MNISQAAKASGLSPRMIRHYENIGLLQAPARSDAGYRQYNERELHTLRFIHSARQLGFSMDDTAQLLALWQDRSRSSAEVKALAEHHLQALEQKIAELQAMHDTLADLARCCQGNERPDCPIINSLATA